MHFKENKLIVIRIYAMQARAIIDIKGELTGAYKLHHQTTSQWVPRKASCIVPPTAYRPLVGQATQPLGH